jgi:hypothetical protein
MRQAAHTIAKRDERYLALLKLFDGPSNRAGQPP